MLGGVLGNYSTRGLDRLGRAFPTAFHAWGKRHFDSSQAVVALLIEHPEVKVLYAMRAARLEILGVLKLCIFVFLIYLSDPTTATFQTIKPNWFVFGGGLFFWLWGMNDFSNPSSISRAISKSTPALDQLEKLR